MKPAGAAPGFHGKVPAVGDFVTRRLPRHFTETWDGWIQASISASRERLGSRWIEIYRCSPMWRFVLSPGACGPSAWAGILMPSVDKVGRCYPLTLATEISGRSAPGLFFSGGGWFERLERVALEALEPRLGVEDFDRMTREETLEPPDPEPRGAGRFTIAERPLRARVELDGVDRIAGAFIELVNVLLSMKAESYSLWGTTGSDLVRPSMLVYEGLPAAAEFAGMLAGRRGIEAGPGFDTESQPRAETDAPLEEGKK